MYVAWHLKGAPDLDTWLGYGVRRRKLIIQAMTKRIEEHNDQFDH